MGTSKAPSALETRVSELIGRSVIFLLPVIVFAGYRLFRYGTPKDQFPHSLVLVIGGIAAIVLIVAYGNLIVSPAKPSWANALTALGGLVPYAYCLYVMAFLGILPLLPLFTDPHEANWLLGIFGLVTGNVALRAFWQITELGNSPIVPGPVPSPLTTPLSQAQVARLMDIFDRYGALIERDGPSGEVIDETVLPYPKAEIRTAICLALASPNATEEGRDADRVCLVLLAQYQPGVGPEPLWPNGLNAKRLDKILAGNPPITDDIIKEVAALSDAENGRRYELFRKKVEEERKIYMKLAENIKPGWYG